MQMVSGSVALSSQYPSLRVVTVKKQERMFGNNLVHESKYSVIKMNLYSYIHAILRTIGVGCEFDESVL